MIDRVLAEIARYQPRELLCDTDLAGYPKLRQYLTKRINCSVIDNVPSRFEAGPALERTKAQFPDRFAASGVPGSASLL